MKIAQLSVFFENREGRLYEVTSLLGKYKINIKALAIADAQDFGVLRLVADKPEDAVEVLKENGFVTSVTDIVAVEVADHPGGLAQILKVFHDQSISVEYMYSFVEKQSDKALLVFRFDDPDRAIEVLKQNKINIIGKKVIQGV